MNIASNLEEEFQNLEDKTYTMSLNFFYLQIMDYHYYLFVSF